MIKLGMVGKVIIHNYPYAAYFNGADDELLRTRCSKTWMLPFLEGQFPEPVAGNSRITHVWAGVRDEAERIAECCRIEHVCGTLEEAIEQVQGVLILDEDIPFRTETVERCLEAGKSVFVDKILALSVNRTRTLVALAEEKGAKIAAWSQTLFDPECDQFKGLPGGAGLVTYNLARDNVLGYGIHLVCLAFAAFGHDSASMVAVDTGAEGWPVVALNYADGKNVILRAGQDLPPSGNVSYFGQGTDCLCARLGDNGTMFRRSAAALEDMFENGREPLPPQALVRMTEAVALLSRTTAAS